MLRNQVTNPFLRAETIDAAIQTFLSEFPIHCDSLFSVRRWHTRLYDQLGRAINHNPAKLLRTQVQYRQYVRAESCEHKSCMHD